MMGSIGNTLRYGNRKTKRLLYSLIILGVFAAFLGVFALIFSNAVLGVLAVTMLFTDIFILAKTNFSKMSMQEQEEKQRAERRRAESEKKREERKQKKEKAQKEEDPGALEWVFSEKKQKEKEQKEEEQQPVKSLQQYDEKQMKKVFIAYKVKREHVPIMIDYCQTERISQCPAYLWKDKEFLYFLLLEEEARMVKCPISEVDGICIRRGVPAKPSAEYPAMQEKSLVSRVFAPYLPNYYRKEAGTYMGYKKNCYSLAEGIWCTSTSVQNMLKILPREFYIEDDKVNSDDYSPYFRKIYIDRILYRDAVLSASDYDKKVRETLASLAHADIADDTFHYYLAQMVMGNLIPQEYADFAVSKRTKKKKI